MIKKYITLDNKLYKVSLFSIWKKLNWDNSYSHIASENLSWRVSPNFIQLLHVCSLCRGVLWVLLFALNIYLITEFNLLFETSNLIVVFFNLAMVCLPVILFELFLLKTTPLEVKKEDEELCS